MKILWICSLPLPEMAKQLGIEENVNGGWLTGLSNALKKEKDIDFVVASNVPESIGFQRGNTKDYRYLSFTGTSADQKEVNPEHVAWFKETIQELSPDIIHIFGTEYAFAAEAVQAAAESSMLDHVVISLQGIMRFCAEHYADGLPKSVMQHQTIREKIKKDSIEKRQKAFMERSRFETYALKHVHHVIGRTEWDRKSALSINPCLHYHYCQETLRPGFYQAEWKYSSCQQHRVFVSQCYYPIKGFHMLLQAVPELVNRYPDLQIVTTGPDFVHSGCGERMHEDSYRYYLRHEILRNGIEKRFFFAGRLDETGMIRQLQKAHVLVNPSSVENSSNSIGEAMLLGTPIVASNTGGTPSIISDGENGYLYPFSDIEKMCTQISKVFDLKEKTLALSQRERKKARELYDSHTNNQQLIRIYKEIMNEVSA
jgi:glycosyltransferase involved in cell wall biosynthesis